MDTPHLRAGFDPARPQVVALHSSGASGRQWRPLRDRLGDDFVLHAPDLYGHGNEAAWLGEARDIVAADAARVGKLVESVPGGAYLVGHSYGAAIALRVALHHPRAVRAVVGYEPVAFRVMFERYGRRRPSAEVLEVAAAIRRELRSREPNRAARRFVDYWAGAGQFEGMRASARAALAAQMPTIAAHFVALAHGHALAEYASLPMPVLLLSGGETREPVRRIAELLASAIPGATHEVLPAMGHMGPMSHPWTVAMRIERHLRARVREAGSRSSREAA